MNLYVFRAVGPYFDGAVGVIAARHDDALALVRLKRDDARRRQDSGDLPNFRTEPFFLSQDAVDSYCEKRKFGRSRPVDHFLLAYTFPLDGLPTAGVVFCHAHEG